MIPTARPRNKPPPAAPPTAESKAPELCPRVVSAEPQKKLPDLPASEPVIFARLSQQDKLVQE